MKITDGMKQFVNLHVGHVIGEKVRFEKLILAIFNRSQLDFKQASKGTFSASETFERRTGNCLSYSAMFISMARYLGLKAHFQEVDDLSSWTLQEGVSVFSKHVNVIVRADGRRYEVDFRSSTHKRLMRRKGISDARAMAHFYNNRAVESLLKNDLVSSRELLETALASDDTFSFAWSNYGLVKHRLGEYRTAEACYKRAFSLEKFNYTAKFNLSNLYEKEGKMDLAEKIRDELKRYLRGNPYYQYSLGRKAYREGDVKRAIKYFRRSHRKMKEEPEFCAGLAASYFRLGNMFAVKKYLKKMENNCSGEKELADYRNKLKYIYLKLK